MASKQSSSKSGDFAKGGSTKMFSKMGVQPSQPGVSAPSRRPSPGNDAPKGGGTGVMGKQGGSIPARPGGASMPRSGVGNSSGFSVSGGSGHMAAKSGSVPAKPL